MKSEQSNVANLAKNYTFQRFEMPTRLLTIYVWYEAALRGALEFVGYGYRFSILYISNTKGIGWIPDVEFNQIGKVVCEKYKNDSGYLPSLEQQRILLAKKFLKICKQIDKTDLSKLAKADLSRLFEKFYQSYLKQYSIPVLANALDFYTQHQIERQLKKINGGRNFAQHLNAFNAPTTLSYTANEKIDLLKILVELKAKNLTLNSSAVTKAIERHAKKYFWLANNYAETKVLDAQFFRQELSQLLSITDPQKEITRIVQFPKKENELKKKLLAKLKLNDPTFKRLIAVQEYAILWRDQRKMFNQIGDHYLFRFATEAARKCNTAVDIMLNMLPKEFEQVLAGNAFSVEELEKRKISLNVFFPEKSQIFVGLEAEELQAILEDTLTKNKELKGTSACLGKCEGVVKIIMHHEEFHKMNKGDILVTGMTRPEFVPLMRMAGAIITDEGGITSHAAIISRELHKPCIIGTKIATRILKDGDIVEVDADRGVVRKIDE